MSVTETDPPFRAMVRASGLGEVWTHSTESSKFNQFGWRCTNKENSFSNDTLIGNWNEERFDNNISRQAQRIPGQVSNLKAFLELIDFLKKTYIILKLYLLLYKLRGRIGL